MDMILELIKAAIQIGGLILLLPILPLPFLYVFSSPTKPHRTLLFFTSYSFRHRSNCDSWW